MVTKLTVLCGAALAALSLSEPANGAVIFTMLELGGDVLVSGSGAFNPCR